jgi:hypothetical protein
MVALVILLVLILPIILLLIVSVCGISGILFGSATYIKMIIWIKEHERIHKNGCILFIIFIVSLLVFPIFVVVMIVPGFLLPLANIYCKKQILIDPNFL